MQAAAGTSGTASVLVSGVGSSMTKRPDDLPGDDRTAANLESIKVDLLDIWRAIDRLERHWKSRLIPVRARKVGKKVLPK